MIDIIVVIAQWIGFFVIGMGVFMFVLALFLFSSAVLVEAVKHIIKYFRDRKTLRCEGADRRDILNRWAEDESILFPIDDDEEKQSDPELER